jgi:hypothetical protein
MDRRALVTNIVCVVRAAKLFGLPVVLSTLQRDWARQETAGPFAEILFAVEGHWLRLSTPAADSSVLGYIHNNQFVTRLILARSRVAAARGAAGRHRL